MEQKVAAPSIVAPSHGGGANFVAGLIWVLIGAVAGGGFLLALLSQKIWSLADIQAYFNF